MSVWRALLSRFVSGFAPSYTDFYDLAYDTQHPAGDTAHQGYNITDVGQLGFASGGGMPALIVIAAQGVTLANGANNDVSTGGKSRVIIGGPTGAFTVSGFTAGADGQLLFVFNNVSQQMTIKNGGTGSSAANRIYTLQNADVVLRAGYSFATLIYSSALPGWVLTATN